MGQSFENSLKMENTCTNIAEIKEMQVRLSI